MNKLATLSTIALLLFSCGKDKSEVNASKAPITFSQLAFMTNGQPNVGQTATYTELMRRPKIIRENGQTCEFAAQDVQKTVVDFFSGSHAIIEDKRTYSILLEGDPSECQDIAEKRSFSRTIDERIGETFNQLKDNFNERCVKSCEVLLESQLIDGKVEAVLTTKGYVRAGSQRINQRQSRRFRDSRRSTTRGFGQENFETTILVLNTDTPWLSAYKKKTVGTQIYYTGGNRLTQREHQITLSQQNN